MHLLATSASSPPFLLGLRGVMSLISAQARAKKRNAQRTVLEKDISRDSIASASTGLVVVWKKEGLLLGRPWCFEKKIWKSQKWGATPPTTSALLV
jgi:hypothetical protein